jgi:transcription elongation factor Elf1
MIKLQSIEIKATCDICGKEIELEDKPFSAAVYPAMVSNAVEAKVIIKVTTNNVYRVELPGTTPREFLDVCSECREELSKRDEEIKAIYNELKKRRVEVVKERRLKANAKV